MKKKALFLSVASLFMLSGCAELDKFLDDFENKYAPSINVPETNNNQSSSQSENQQNNSNENQGNQSQGNENQGNENQGNENQGEETTSKKIGEFYGGVVENNEYTGYEFSKSESEIAKPTTGVGEIKIYAFNDFHGSVVQNDTEPGLKAVGTFFKEKSQQENTLIFDQGDTWQGSLESNYQYGAIVQDVFNYAGVSLRIVGNHDFDWGLSHLENTQNRKIGDDYIPALASNVYDYANGVNGTNQQGQLGKEYATFVLDNGIKIGVVGVIGSSQITSICTQLVEDVCFTDHIAKAKEISDYLRKEKGCDIIVVSAHEGTAAIHTSGLDEVSPVSNKRYADLVLSGHDHYKQEETENGVKYVQWASNGKSAGLVTLKYNFETNAVVDEDTTVNSYYTNYFKTYYSETESTINKMIDDYLEVTEPVASEVLSTNFSGTFDDESMARLMTEAIYDRVSQQEDIDFAVCNYARDGFSGSTFTYGDLYKCFPFDNQIILMNVNTNYDVNDIKWNFSYSKEENPTPTGGNNYRVAVIDYLGLHQDDNRQPNKFKDATNVSVFNDTEGDAPNYRDILYSYLKKNSTKEFNASDYTTSNPHFYK